MESIFMLDYMTGDMAAIRSDSWRAWDLTCGLYILWIIKKEIILIIFIKDIFHLALVTSITGIILFFKKTI